MIKNKFNKTLFSLTMTVSLLSTTLVGCGSSGSSNATDTTTSNTPQSNNSQSSTDDEIVVDFWHYYGGNVETLFNDIVKEFNETIGVSEGIIVEATSKNNLTQLEEDINKAANGVIYADGLPNMFLTYADTALELIDQDLLINFDDYFTQDDLSIFSPSFLVEGNIYGKQYILPIVKSSELVYINKTNWEIFSNDTGYTYDDLETWESITEVAKSYYEYTDAKTPDIENDGKGLIGIDSVSNYVTISAAQLGTNIFNSDEEKALISDATLGKSFDMYVSNMALRYFDKIGKFCTDDIRSCDIIAFAGSSASAPFFPNWIEENGAQVDIEWKAIPYPYFENGENLVLIQGAGIGATKSNEREEEACAKFIEFLLEPERNIEFSLMTGYIPVVEEFFNESTINSRLEILSNDPIYENRVDVYNLVLDRINNDGLYSSTAFNGSFEIRDSIGNNFHETANLLEEYADNYRADGITDDEIIELLQLDKEFNELVSVVKDELQRQNINFD